MASIFQRILEVDACDCELFYKEIERLIGINIEVNGFDSGIGLFAAKDYMDFPEVWMEDDYRIDATKLQDSLQYPQPIIGDICKTTKAFLAAYNPAPIGVILVDVDQYTPTIAIFDLLQESDEYFLPKVICILMALAHMNHFAENLLQL